VLFPGPLKSNQKISIASIPPSLGPAAWPEIGLWRAEVTIKKYHRRGPCTGAFTCPVNRSPPTHTGRRFSAVRPPTPCCPRSRVSGLMPKIQIHSTGLQRPLAGFIIGRLFSPRVPWLGPPTWARIPSLPSSAGGQKILVAVRRSSLAFWPLICLMTVGAGRVLRVFVDYNSSERTMPAGAGADRDKRRSMHGGPAVWVRRGPWALGVGLKSKHQP